MSTLRNRLPPGVVYFAGIIPSLTLHALSTYVILGVAAPSILKVTLPTWSLAILSFFSLPVVYTATWMSKPYFDARKARAQGMVMAPRVGGSPFKILQRLGDASREGYMGQALYEWVKGTGIMTVAHRFYNAEVIYTLEPEHVKAILATQFESFEKGYMFIEQMTSLLGVGIFNSDGEMWKFHRAMTRPFFTRERISDFHIYDRNAAQTLAIAKERLDEGHSVDFQDLVGRFTLDSATEFLCGQNVGSLTASLPYPPSISESPYSPPPSYSNDIDDHPSTQFLAAFAKAQALAGGRSALGRDWPILEFWKDEVKPLRELLDDFTKPLLERALSASVEDGKADAKEESCLLDYLVKHTQDPRILKDEMVNLLVAGRDTTSSLLSFCFYMLCEHPEIEQRLRQEILEKVGPHQQPTYDNMREMKYTRAFLNEVMRLYPPVPVDSRMANKPTSLPCKNGETIYVPAGTGCLYSVMYMHRRTDLWGPDALKFDPDRFLDSRLHKYLTPNPFIFCPFNAGPRICLGQQFAYHETTFFLVRLLQNFTHFELDHAENLPPDPVWGDLAHRGGSNSEYADKIRLSSHLTMYIKGGLWVKMKPYKHEQQASGQ